jgi:hypothetical protein
MKRALYGFLAFSCFIMTFYVSWTAWETYAADAPIRARIELLRNGSARREAEAAVAKAHNARKAYCGGEGIVCRPFGPAFKIDKATGIVAEDPSYDQIALAIRTAEAVWDASDKNIWYHERETAIPAVMAESLVAVMAAVLGIVAAFRSLRGLQWKKPRTPAEASPEPDLSQDAKDLRRLAELRAKLEAVEQRLAPRSYREPDRSLEPASEPRVETDDERIRRIFDAKFNAMGMKA